MNCKICSGYQYKVQVQEQSVAGCSTNYDTEAECCGSTAAAQPMAHNCEAESVPQSVACNAMARTTKDLTAAPKQSTIVAQFAVCNAQ